MQTEHSAGGIIVFHNKKHWIVLLMQDMNGNWTFPKGLIEKSEDPLAAAQREIKEEVGIDDLIFVSKLSPVEYFYYRGGSIKKTVNFFLFKVAKKVKPVVQTKEGISQAQWFSFDKAMKIIGYPKTNSPLLKESLWKLNELLM